MTKFNKANTNKTKTTNLAGGPAFTESPKLEFVSILLTSFVKDQFYRSEDEGLQRTFALMDAIPDKTFPAKAAIYARTKYGMRSISHVVAAYLASIVKGESWTKKFYDKVVYRPDDITEILSFYCSNWNKPLPNSLKKGLATAFNKFDEYSLAKYRGEGKDISLVDAVNLLHPRPTEKNQEALKKLMAGTLKSKDTWESKLTEAGQKAKTDEEKEELKAEAWKELVKTKKIGYFALLRNLRNIIEQAPEVLDSALELLVEPNLIHKSLVLPFRFVTAIEEIKALNGTGVRKVLTALGKAVDISLANVPKFDGDTLVVLDGSGSMSGQPVLIGSLFAAVLYKSNNADLIVFDSSAEYHTLNANDSTLTVSDQIKKLAHGGGTNFDAPLEEANRKYDRIVFLSDMQGWMSGDAPTGALGRYKKRTGANPKIYSFDLQGYGTLQFPQPNVYCLAGFSEKTFDVMKLLETDRNALIAEIEKIEL